MRTGQRYQSTVTRGKATATRARHVVIALVIPLVVYFGFSAGQRALDVHRLNEEASRIRAETEMLKAENARLRREIQVLGTDAYVEQIAREELNLVKPGDKAVVVLAAEGRREAGGSTGVVPAKEDESPNWLKWWSFFFGPRG